MKKRWKDFVDKLMHAAIANHYNYDDYDGAGSLHATLQNKAII
jgi:hypothetical protein